MIIKETRHQEITWQQSKPFYLAISPWLCGLVFISLGPTIVSFAMSFFEWEIITPPRFVGVHNYTRMLRDPLLFQSLKVTFIYILIKVPLDLVLSISLSILMNQKIKGIRWFRTIYYLPSVVAGVAIAQAWKVIFNPDLGILNYLLQFVGLPCPRWTASDTWALPTIIIIGLWKFGGNMVIFLAGLQSIPIELYDAAKVDGAGPLHRLRHITVPMLSPSIFFCLVMGIIQGLQVFAEPYVLTEGGPANATLSYVLYLYRQAFDYFRMGYASALAWILFLITLTITLLLFRTAPSWVHYEAEGSQ